MTGAIFDVVADTIDRVGAVLQGIPPTRRPEDRIRFVTRPTQAPPAAAAGGSGGGGSGGGGSGGEGETFLEEVVGDAASAAVRGGIEGFKGGGGLSGAVEGAAGAAGGAVGGDVGGALLGSIGQSVGTSIGETAGEAVGEAIVDNVRNGRESTESNNRAVSPLFENRKIEAHASEKVNDHEAIVVPEGRLIAPYSLVHGVASPALSVEAPSN